MNDKERESTSGSASVLIALAIIGGVVLLAAVGAVIVRSLSGGDSAPFVYSVF